MNVMFQKHSVYARWTGFIWFDFFEKEKLITCQYYQ